MLRKIDQLTVYFLIDWILQIIGHLLLPVLAQLWLVDVSLQVLILPIFLLLITIIAQSRLYYELFCLDSKNLA